MTVLKVADLGKAYKSYPSEWHRLARLLGFWRKPLAEHWVLRHLNFELQAGEAIGVIGVNGAGKSTLLKMIAGTLNPTEGVVHRHGRIAAILELGMGFNPEMTGRQNVFQAAGLMGFSNAEIRQALPDIEEFAEIGEYFDQPIRTYSSGMQIRVAFSVATAFRPDMLIIDEALSVGDAYFQHKSFDRIRQFQRQGTTLLLVSHDRRAVLSICNRAILLDGGDATKEGPPEEIFDYYNAIIAQKEGDTVELTSGANGKIQTSSGTGEARVTEIGLFNEAGNRVQNVAVGEAVELRIKVRVWEHVDTLVLGYGIRNRFGEVIYGTNTWYTDQAITKARQGDEYEFRIAFPADFGPGSYSVQTALVDSNTHMSANFDWQDFALMFEVENRDKPHFEGCMWNDAKVTVRKTS